MQVTFVKRGQRTTLICRREDGTAERADLGPSLPYHDLGHFVAESSLGLTQGFFGAVASGRTIAELSDPEVIPTLGPASMQAEVAARGVGSLATGACRPDQFDELVNSELGHLGLPLLPDLSADRANALLVQFRELVARFEGTSEGESLTLSFGED